MNGNPSPLTLQLRFLFLQFFNDAIKLLNDDVISRDKRTSLIIIDVVVVVGVQMASGLSTDAVISFVFLTKAR